MEIRWIRVSTRPIGSLPLPDAITDKAQPRRFHQTPRKCHCCLPARILVLGLNVTPRHRSRQNAALADRERYSPKSTSSVLRPAVRRSVTAVFATSAAPRRWGLGACVNLRGWPFIDTALTPQPAPLIR